MKFFEKGIEAVYIKELCINDIHISYMNINETNIDCDKSEFSDYRLKRLNTVKSQKSKEEGIAAEQLLIHTFKKLGITMPLDINADRNGKPFLKDSKFIFSIAHSGDYAVCAVSKKNIGIDIEQNRRENQAIAKKYYSEKEKKCNFTQIWCRKEAVVKADGRGISLGIGSFDVSDNETVLDGIYYRLYDIAAPDNYTIAAAERL